MNMQVQQQITERLRLLTPPQLTEVLDFVEFLHTRQHAVSADSSMVDVVYGKYKPFLSSSENFARRKQEEIRQEEAKWQRR